MANPRGYGNLIAAIATIAVCDIAMGLTFQLQPLILEQRGVSAAVIGLQAAMGPLGILLAGPILPRLIGRFGAKRAATVSILATLAVFAAFNVFPSLAAWFIIRFIFGIAAGTLFTVSEAWVMTFTAEGMRGRVMGLYTSVLSVTFAVGPIIIPLTGIAGWLPWIIGMVCVALGAVPLAFVNASEDMFKGEAKGAFTGFIGRAPLLLFAVLAVTMTDGIFLAFFSIFAIRSGHTLETASWVLAAGILGNVIFQPLIGLVADRWSRTGVIITAALVTVASTIALVWAVGTVLIWPVMMIAGSSAFAAYTIALTTMGDEFTGPDLIAGSAAMSVIWGLGGVIGPPLAGAAIDRFGVSAMPLGVALIYVILIVGLLATGGKLVRAARP